MAQKEKIYHIVESDVWRNKIKDGFYYPDSLKSEGYVHCCMENQIRNVLSQWFPDQNKLELLVVKPEQLDSPLIFENTEGGEELFPHIYGPINLNAVVEIQSNIKEKK